VREEIRADGGKQNTGQKPVFSGSSEAGLLTGAHGLELGAQIFTLFGQLGILDDVIVDTLFIVDTHVGDDGLNLIYAHTRLDIVAQVVKQQYPLLVITDLLLVVGYLALEFVLATGHTHIFQYIAEGGLVYWFHIDTTD